jgi:hypothetical protein
MRRTLGPLLCELHAHTRWSDGALTVAELVDLHGRNGFDVLCVTDHVIRTNDPWCDSDSGGSVDEDRWSDYLADVEREAARAWRTYGMLVIPGLKLTFNDEEPVKAAHAVAIGLQSFVSVDLGIAEAMQTAAEAGAAIVAAHPPVRRRARACLATDATLRKRCGAARARPPLRAVQPDAALRLGRRRGAPGSRLRRLPPP